MVWLKPVAGFKDNLLNKHKFWLIYRNFFCLTLFDLEIILQASPHFAKTAFLKSTFTRN